MSRNYVAGDPWQILFTVSSSTGAAVNVDSGLPTAKLFHNGVADTNSYAAVTVANVETGVYQASMTLPNPTPSTPTYLPLDDVEIVAYATVGGVARKQVLEAIRLGGQLAGVVN